MILSENRLIGPSSKIIFGWSFALIIPFLIHLILIAHQVNWSVSFFVTFLSCALVLGIFRLTSPFLQVLLVVTSCLLLNNVPYQLLLSGFASSAFFLLLSLLCLAAVILKSGILHRSTLWLLYVLPRKFYILEIILVLMGLILSIFINVQVTRFDLMLPFYKKIIEQNKFTKNIFAQQSLSLVFYVGAIYFSELFLTGKATNPALYAMLPEQVQTSFTWAKWTLAAVGPVLLMLIPYLICVAIFYRHNFKISIDKKEIKDNLSQLGPLSMPEYIAIFGIILLIIGIVLSSLQIVNLAWFSLAILFVLLLFPVLNKDEFRSYINWSFLFYVGSLIGLVAAIRYLKIDTTFVNYLSFLTPFLESNIFNFIIVIFAICFLSTLLIGTVASIILLFPLLLPFATQLGINPWILVFVISVSCEAWLFPYESIYQLYFEELEEHKSYIQMSTIIKMNALFCVFRLGGLLLGVFYWKYLGIL